MNKEGNMKFNELNVNSSIIKAIDELKFETMMPIQEKTIPVILQNKNIIGEAETGTGKTAAFLIPMLNGIDFNSGNIEALIVTPTRELAMQIVKEITKIGKYLNVSYATLVGGMSIQDQNKDLKRKPSIIVGTLGRVNDHLRAGRLNLNHVKYFVLDEADEMLKEGFKEDIAAINSVIPVSKQSLLFSATISKPILKLSEAIMDNYEFITVKDKNSQSLNIEQYYMIVKEKNKFPVLIKLLDIDKPEMAIIFGRTKRRADELNEALVKCGYKSTCIHGDLSQGQRNAVMTKFRNKQINILVATDVAARGLDISGVTHVYNFDLPQEVEFYIHRIGRTGRANEHGKSYSFIKETELPHIRRIERETKIRISEKLVPTNAELREARKDDVTTAIKNILKDIDITRSAEFARELIDEFGAERMVSVLIENLSRKEVGEVTLTGEPPVKVRQERGFNNRGNRNYIADRNVRKRAKKRVYNSDNRGYKRTGNRHN